MSIPQIIPNVTPEEMKTQATVVSDVQREININEGAMECLLI